MPLLNWINDKDARTSVKQVPFHLLSKLQSFGDKEEAGKNLLIQGDNLTALKALLPFYRGKVKCIYIDPPYNTGSAFEHYDDKLEHSQWLSMMFPRLSLLRDFLTEDGSIWVSIDDEEQAYLKVIMDEIFGRENFLCTIAWEKTDSPKNDARFFYERYESILVYSKSEISLKINLEDPEDDIPEHYNKIDKDNRLYYLKPLRCMGQRVSDSLFYPLISPDGEEVLPFEDKAKKKKSGWRWSKQKVLDESERIEWVKGKSGWNPYFRIYADSRKATPLSTLWTFDYAGSNRLSKKEIRELFGPDNQFKTPKPEKLIQRIIEASTDRGDIVLDSFLGSGTTAAVAQKMGRQYIGIEIGQHAQTHCLPRLKQVIEGEQGGISKAVDWKGGGGFSFYKLGPAVFDKFGTINSAVNFETLSAYIWQKETGTTTEPTKSPLLGVSNGTSIFLLYNGILGDKRPEAGNVLTPHLLSQLEEKFPTTGERIIYAEAVFGLSDDDLKQRKITFKQLPYDIRG